MPVKIASDRACDSSVSTFLLRMMFKKNTFLFFFFKFRLVKHIATVAWRPLQARCNHGAIIATHIAFIATLCDFNNLLCDCLNHNNLISLRFLGFSTYILAKILATSKSDETAGQPSVNQGEHWVTVRRTLEKSILGGILISYYYHFFAITHGRKLYVRPP